MGILRSCTRPSMTVWLFRWQCSTSDHFRMNLINLVTWPQQYKAWTNILGDTLYIYSYDMCDIWYVRLWYVWHIKCVPIICVINVCGMCDIHVWYMCIWYVWYMVCVPMICVILCIGPILAVYDVFNIKYPLLVQSITWRCTHIKLWCQLGIKSSEATNL